MGVGRREPAGWGARVRQLRRQRGLTQDELAGRAGLSVGALRDLEQGRSRRPRPRAALRLGEALGLSASAALELAGSAADLHIRVLGPLEVHVDGQPADPGSAGQRVLLAVLALAANTRVSRDALIDAVWPTQSPAGAADLLQSRVSRLRQRLGPPADPDRPLLVAARGGYQLAVTEEQLDLLRFRRLREAARRGGDGGDPTGAFDLYAEALELWRGAPVADLAGLRAHPAVAALAREGDSAVLEYADLAAALGRYERSLPRLRRLTDAESLHEAAYARLMTALAATGRQAEALTVYDQLRRRLADELGVDPGAELAAAYQAILAGSPAAAAPPPAPAARPRPAQLPADVPAFAGRQAQVDALAAQLRGGSTSVVVCAISGMGGIGKTALAVHAAHRVRAEYPDGQLYLDLRGALPTPTPTTDLLARLLRDLGAAGDAIPEEEQERAALYRSLLHGRRILIVLDNAARAAQVQPLIPGDAGCAVIVTSRAELSALPATYRVALPSLDPTVAGTLLAALVGARWRSAEQSTVDKVIDACAGLPLAIHIAARRLASRPNWSLRTLADRLADQRRRLDELQVDDLAVRASFMVSYRAASAGPSAPGRLFRLLGLTEAPTISLPAAAALAGQPLDATEDALEALVDAHLVESPGPTRYRLHDLLGVYAAELVRAEESTAERRAALHRLLTWYLHTAQSAAMRINPQRHGFTPDRAALAFDTYDDALGWLDTEHENLTEAVRLAHRCEWHDIAWRLPIAMWDLYLLRGHRQDWIDALRIALRGVRLQGDRSGEAQVLNDLGGAYLTAGRTADALDAYRSALPLAREHGADALVGRLLANIGMGHDELDQYPAAIDALEQALAIFERLDAPAAVTNVLTCLAFVEHRVGECARALDHYRRGLATSRAVDDEYGQARVLDGLSEVLRDMDRLDEAAGCAREAIAISRRIGYLSEEGNALMSLTDALGRLGDVEQARRHWRAALAILEQVSDPHTEKLRDDIAAKWHAGAYTPSG